MRCRLFLVVAVAVAIGVSGGEAEGQVWHPKGKRPSAKRGASKKAPAQKKKAPARKKRAAQPADDEYPDRIDDEDVDWDSVDSYGPGSSSGSGADGDADAGGNGDAGGDADGDGNGSDGDDFSDLGEGETLRLDDDDGFDDVGADVTFDSSDLASDATSSEAGAGVTRLETLAMGFARMGIDTVHDEVPVTPEGIEAIGEDVISLRVHGRAEGTSRFGRRLKVKVAGRVNAELSLDGNTNVGVQRYEAEIWDTHADLYLKKVDIRFGNQIVAWGAADLLSPNDVVNPRDLRRGFMESPDELRIPVLALTATAYDGPFFLEGVWVPIAPANRFELLEGDYALLGPNAATPAERRVGAIVATLADDPTLGLALRPLTDIGEPPDNGLESGELGARAGIRLRKLDVAGYFLWGHERNPRVQLTPELAELILETPPEALTPEALAQRIGELSMMGVSPVEVDYPRRIHAGAAVAGRIEPLGLKAEVGYAPEANTVLVPPGQGPLLAENRALPQVQVTGSVDYDRGNQLTVILEASLLRVLDVPAERDVYQMDHDRLWLIGGRFTWTPRAGPVELGFLGFVDPTSPSYALRPSVRLSGHDNLSVEIAATLFGGPSTSYGGIADRNDEVLLTFQYGL